MTKMKNDDLRRRAGELLSHFIPRDILREAHELALSFQREEAFRAYVANRVWLVIPVAFVFVLVSTICALAVMLFLMRSIAFPVALLLGAGVWIGGVVSQLYLFFAWLEIRALGQNHPMRASSSARPTAGAFSTLHRSWIPWLFIALFVGVPVGLLTMRAPAIAVLLIVAAFLAPHIYRHFDR